MMLFFNREGQTHLVYTRRTRGMNLHSGQMSFPGGKIEPGDASSYITAARETYEEIGIRADQYSYLGEMGFFETLTSRYDAAAHVGWCPQPPQYKLNTFEVAEVVEFPLKVLGKQFRADLDFDNEREVMYLNFNYKTNDMQQVANLWGLTARITHHFIQGLTDYLRDSA